MVKYANDSFDIVRSAEIERLVRFLEVSQGGMLLLGGDRGVGKTKLVSMAIEQYEKRTGTHREEKVGGIFPRYPRTLTRAKTIKVHIPLIVLDDKEDEGGRKEKYRSMLMRAIIVGLEADLRKRYYPGLDLPKRWFSAIGYVQSVYALTPYAHYIKLSRTSTRNLATQGVPIAAGLQGAMTAEIDLADSTIEIKLRNLLSEYSKLHDFIFIFDELDKLPEDIEVEKIVLYLKNLFSETGVHAIFISSEKDLERVISKANNGTPPKEESTLFLDLLFLNSLKVDDFAQLVSKRVIGVPDSSTDLNELTYALALRTKRSPNELNKFFMRHGLAYAAILHGVKAELGSEKFKRFTVLQAFIYHVYQKYSQLYDEQFRRLLEDALQQAGALLLESDDILMDRIDTYTIFYSHDDFQRSDISDEQALINEKLYKAGGHDELLVGKEPDIVTRIFRISDESADQYVSILYAVECLVVLMNRSGHLPITDTDSEGIVMLKRVSGAKFNLKNLKDLDLDAAFELTVEERSTLSTLTKYNYAYRSLSKSDIYGDLPIFAVDGKERELESPHGIYSMTNSKLYWEQLAGVAEDAPNRLLRLLVDSLKKLVSRTIDDKNIAYYGNYAVITLANGKMVKLQILFDGQRFKIESEIEKIFILRDQTAKFKRKNTFAKVRNFEMHDKWTRVNSTLKHVAHWMNKNSE